MHGSRIAAAALVALTPALGACQSIFGGQTAFGESPPARADQPVLTAIEPGDVYAAAQIAEGRTALDTGQPGLAIAAFRNAKQFPSHTGESANGLAIAYSRLGRADLAERYFQQAVAFAPADARFAANLQRFYASRTKELPRAAAASGQPASGLRASNAIQVISRGQTILTVSQPASRMVRVSAKEVRVGAGGSTPAVAQPLSRSTAVSAAARSVKPATNYPIRVTLSSREIFVGSADARTSPVARPRVAVLPAYPVRVEMKTSR
ncbi:MAG TPA: hypothetical protein VJM34_07025 [Novosphingobium sp.]|nr:hypothetical protein [Novosphingobium sp.]